MLTHSQELRGARPKSSSKGFGAISELRQDPVTGDWVLIATGRARRPDDFKSKPHKAPRKTKRCPFENPQETGHGDALLLLPEHGEWFIQVVQNKFPALGSGICSLTHLKGPFSWVDGVGFHEVIIYRDHDRGLVDFSDHEITMTLETFRNRYQVLREGDCIEYVSMFHNYGASAGASVAHPHSQIIATPVIPPNVARSLKGSKHYFEAYQRCVHCSILAFEIEEHERVIEETAHFVALAPYVSRTAFEVRIFPKDHIPSFRKTPNDQISEAAVLLRNMLKKIARGLNDPALNFYIHTAPVRVEDFPYYHWHIEILPKTAIWAGFELGTGIEISTIAPESAAQYLREITL